MYVSKAAASLLLWSILFSSFAVNTRSQTVRSGSNGSDESVKTETSGTQPFQLERFGTNDLSVTVAPNINIPDNGYTGAAPGTGGAVCSSINLTPVVPSGVVVSNVSANVTITHTWIGDLTIKLVAPNGAILTLLNRPGSTAADNGIDTPIGDSTNWGGSSILFGDGAGTEAETMGNTLTDAQSICINDGRCAHDPSPDTAPSPPASFADLNDQSASGVWSMCVGDSVSLDTGTFTSWTLNLTYAHPVAATVNQAIPDDGYTGGFGGAGQLCSTINTTSLNVGPPTVLGVYLDVDLTHTWIGDLTIKLRSPNNTILTVLNRPGTDAPDNGTAGPGSNANWNGYLQFKDGSPFTAETMGTGLTDTQLVCTNNGRCKFTASPDTATQPPTSFAAFNGEPAAGNWTLCVGDSASQDLGTLRSWRLNFVSPSNFVPTSAAVMVSGRALTSKGQPVRGAIIRLIDINGEVHTATSNPFGYFRFDGVQSGKNYIIEASSKSFSFEARSILISDQISDLELIATDR